MGRSRLEIVIVNRQQGTRLSLTKLLGWTKKILRLIGWKQTRMSLVLVNDAEIRLLHRQYLGKDRATDVLAFRNRKGKPFLGEVVVSVDAARRMAPRFGNRWGEELLLYVCHGMLHLLGHRDSTASQKAQMNARQEKILGKVLGKKWRSKKRKRLF